MDIDKEITSLLKEQAKVQKQLQSVSENVTSGAGQAARGLMIEQSRIQSRLNTLKEQDDLIQKNLNKNQSEIIRLTKERIGLEYTEDEQRKQKVKQLREIQDLEITQADYLAREYDLRKAILENLIKNNDKVVS